MSETILARLGRGDLDPLRELLLHEPRPASACSEYDLDPGLPPAARVLADAAVLVPIVLRQAPTVLFTRRTGHLTRHAGQISFPGGRCEVRDESASATALRETQEETGIDPGLITIAGFLDRHETGTGYAIQPVVGVLSEGFALAPDRHEVAEIFEVPLVFLLDPESPRLETRDWMGRVRHFHIFRYGAHEIWGATAAILVDLAGRLGDAPASGMASPAPLL